MNQYSGAENVAVTICRKLGKQYEFAYTCPDGPIRQWLEKEKIYFYPMAAFCAFELKRVLKAYQPDIVHAHDFSASVLCGYMKKDFFLISHLHNNPHWIQEWNAKTVLYRMTKNRLDRIFLVSDAIVEEAVFLSRLDPRVVVIGNPVDKERIRSMACRGDAGQSDLLYVGRLTEQKDPLCFIRIVKELWSQGIKARAVMLGDGELLPDCEKQIEEYGMTQEIKMVGFCRNPYPYMRQAKLLLIPSKWEGFGLVAAEAVVLGVPVLANAVGGLKDMLGDCPQALCAGEAELCCRAGRLLLDAEYYEAFRRCERENARFPSMENYSSLLEQYYG